jgi:hypothetical protein
MDIKVTPEFENFLKQSEKFFPEDKDILIWAILQKYADKTNSIQQIKFNEMVAYIFMPVKQTLNNENQTKERKFGLWKNKIGNISPDFNDPIDDLTEYM